MRSPTSRASRIHLALATALTAACAASAPPPQHAEPAVTATPAATPAPATPAPAAPPAAPEGEPVVAAPATTRAAPPPRQTSPEDNYPPVRDEPQRVAIEPRHPEPTRPDPLHGHFTLADATAGMPPGGELVADIQTTQGTFHCALLANEAPATVANFVGLARGVRDFWDPVAGRWTRRPFYDGSVFHRVIPGFMVQGGDILRSGHGGPGYELRDENVGDHDAAGLLCMANHGPNTGGAQFFITEVGLARLNGSYSVFGRCTPVDLVERIARVPRSPHDQPITPVTIQHVEVHRATP